jgi:hypothetical protein
MVEKITVINAGFVIVSILCPFSGITTDCFVSEVGVGFSRIGSFLFRGISEKIDKAERDKCQHQNNHKENKTAYDAILKTFSARDFDAIKYPVGHEVEAAGDQCVVNDFHVNAPKKFTHVQYIMTLVLVEMDSTSYFSCNADGIDARTLN